MKNSVYFISITLLTSSLLSASAEAKSVGSYGVRVRVEGNPTADVLTALAGFRCTTSSGVSFKEKLPDNQGRLREIPREYSADSSFLISTNQHIMEIEKNLSRTDEDLDVTINQTCQKEVPVLKTRDIGCQRKPDGTEYGCIKQYYTELESKFIYMGWSCKFHGNLPTRVNGVSTQDCQPKSHNFSAFMDLEAAMLQLMNSKKIFVDTKLRKVEEKYLRNFCDASNNQNKVILQLSQGLGGHSGENDFVLNLKIDGKHNIDIPSTSGILDDEIAYCGAGNKIHIQAKGVEKDWIWDDHYLPQNELNLDRSGASSQGVLRLKRKSYLGATDKDHSVLVKVQDKRRAGWGSAERDESNSDLLSTGGF